MALPETTDFDVTNEWTAIVAGPAADLHIEVNGQVIYYRLQAAMPTTNFGHRLDDDVPSKNIELTGAAQLWVRTKGTKAILVVTGE